MSDAPIEPKEYLCGVKVVQIEDLRVARGMTRRPFSSCRHRKLVYDDKERRVWCSDCESEVEPFDAFTGLVERMDGHIKNLKSRELKVKEAESFSLRSRAAKAMDMAWRSRKMVPQCPSCNSAIFPEDVLPSPPCMNKEWAARLRASKQEKNK